MQPVSDAYLAQHNLPVKNAAEGQVLFDLVAAGAAEAASFAAQNPSALSNFNSMLAARPPQQCYASFEAGRFVLGSRQCCVPDEVQGRLLEGYISQAICSAEGVFSAAPLLEITFATPQTMAGLTLRFDDICGDYAAAFTLAAYQGSTLLNLSNHTPSAPLYLAEGDFTNVTRFVLTFMRMNVGLRRLRIQQILFGKQLCFGSAQVQSITLDTAVDPLSRHLPTGTLQFSVINRNSLTGDGAPLYDPENPNGLGKYIQQRSAVQVRLGQTLAQGVEWLESGRYYLTAQPTTQNLLAKFEAQDTLSLLTNTYTQGVYAPQGISLHALATAVLQASNLPVLTAGQNPWVLWHGLAALTTTAPLPVKSARECLQLIAHAGGCALYCLRDGRICLAPPAQGQAVAHLGFAHVLAEPTSEKSATLHSAVCNVHHLRLQPEASCLHEGTYTVNGSTYVHISHKCAANIVPVVQGAAVLSCQSYAYTTVLQLQGQGSATVTLHGYLLDDSTSSVIATVPNADANAATEEIDNPLITSTALAQAAAARTRDYLLQRTAYTCDTLGYPELDALDSLTLQTLYTDACPVTVLSAQTTLENGLRTALTLKRRQQDA